ncbi:MAG: aldo/keto reductase, partial [Gammaproteobacteria bacterium]|nr:aldo/keto reductase [Gammaproteobacteria bacterium]
STKAGRLLVPDPTVTGDALRHGFRSPMPFQPAYDYSYDGIMRSVEQSRQRLGLARIDILLVHDIGRLTHGEQHLAHLDTLRRSGYRALEALRTSGEVAAIGLGVNEWQVCDEALDWGSFDCFLLAGRYTLLEQAPLERFFPRCAAAGTSLILGGIFNSGILAVGTASAEQPLHYNYAPADPAVIARVRAIEEICRAWSVALPAAALQFPIAHPQVAAILCGARSADELAASLRHYRSAIPPGFWSDLRSAGLIAEAAPVPASTKAAS